MASQALTARRHNQTVLDSLEKGDMIEFPRGLYSHWALYIGNNEVVHLAGDEDDGIDRRFDSTHFFSVSGRSFQKAEVKIDKFWDVAENSLAKKNNGKDGKFRPLPKAQILRNALSKLGTIGYNVLSDNCEHFVAWCRYGEKKSDQVDNLLTGLAFGTAAAATVGFLYWLSRDSKSEEKEEEL